jgi:hypothetical protein
MSNLATIVNNILADSGIDDINVVVTTGSYTNPAWIVSLPWTKITGTPTTLAGYGITDAYTQTQVNNLLNAKLSLSGGTMTGVIGLPNGTVGIQVGDDATIADRNVANTMYVAGVQNTDRGYINFSESAGNQLGAINGGDLTWRGVPIITTSNVSGTVNYIPKFTAANSVGNSVMSTDASGNFSITVSTSVNNSPTFTVYSSDASSGLGNPRIILSRSGEETLRLEAVPNVEGRIKAVAANAGVLTFYTGTDSEKMRLDALGMLGLGVTPSAWGTSFKAFQIGSGSNGGSVFGDVNYSVIHLASNVYHDGTNFKYIKSGEAAAQFRVYAYDGSFLWDRAGVAPSAGANITWSTIMKLDASGRLGVGIDPTQSLDVNGNGKFRGQDLFLGSSVDADNVIYIYSKNGAQSQIRTNAGVSGSYNGIMIASNYNQANTLPSWSLDLGGALNSTGNVNTFTVGYKAFGGAWASLMIVNANGDTVVSNNFTSASAVFNNGTNSTNGIKIVSTTSSSAFTGGIEFIRTTVAGGSKIQPLRDISIGGVGFNFLVTADNAAEISATYTSAIQVANTGNTSVGTTISKVRLNTVGVTGGTNGGGAYAGNSTYYGGGKAAVSSYYGDEYGNGAPYGTSAGDITPYTVWYGGGGGGYFKGGAGSPGPGGGGAGIVAIGGNGSTYDPGAGYDKAQGGAGIYARGGLNGDGSTRTWAGYFEGTIAVTGAATFSSSVTSTGLIVNGAEFYFSPANYASGGFTRLLGRNSSTGRIEGMSAADVQAFIGLSSYISGSGTTNTIPKFTSSSAIGNSVIIDNGTDVTVGNALRVNAFGNVAGGTIRMGAVNNGTEKWSYLVSTQYNSSSNPQGFSVIGAYTTATANQIVIGGSIYEANPATEIQFWTHTAVTHGTGGSKRMTIDTNGNVGINTATPSQKFEVSGGAIIASGFGNRAAGTGKALEIGMDGTNAILQAIDRTASAFIPIAINSSGATFNNSVTATQFKTPGFVEPTSVRGLFNNTNYSGPGWNNASLVTGNGATGVMMGGDAATYTYGWIQGVQTDNGGIKNLSLNPLGGNVGVGTFTSITSKFTVQGTQSEIHVKNDDTRALTLGGWDGTRQYIKSINLGVALTPLTLQASSFNFDTGLVGINTTNPQAGLQIEKYGSKFDSDVQYNQPAGNVFLSVTGAVADQANWFGMRGSYNSSTGSANLLLQANYRDVNSQAGHYISSKAQSLGVADFIIGKLVTTTSVSTPPTLVPQLTIAASGAVTISNNASPGLNISKDASLDNRYLRLTNTQASSVNWDLINQQNVGGNSFIIYNATANATAVEITPTGNMTASGVIGWYSGIGALSYGSGFVTMETNTANAIQFKTNGTTALTLNTNQTARFANSVGIGRDATYNLDVNGSIRGSDRLYWNGTNQLVYILNYQNLPYEAEVVTDTTANQGTAIRKPSGGFGGSTFFYGNYTSFPPGNYVAYFRMKVTSNASGASLGQLDVVGADIVPFAISLRPNMFDASNTWQYIRLPFTITGGGYIEWRMVGFQTGITDLFFDHVMIYQEASLSQIFVRNAFSVYVNQNTLGMQLNTSGALTVTSSVTATSFFESSDERLKSNIIDLDANVSSIIAKSYLKNGMQEIGYLAQDVERILPSAISKRDDGYLDLSYRQVHTAKIAALEKEVFELKQQLKNK